MDPNLLVSVIKAQAGTLSKAILEGVMNSLDAKATRVDVTLTQTNFVIADNGKGFGSADEIKIWFGRFGTPHKAGDATYGKFRMGRGQMMSFAATTWLSNEFCMKVDIEKNGLTYDLSTRREDQDGCRVEGELYVALSTYEFKDILTELKKFVAYTPKPVYVNGELFGASPARLKSWTFENENAYFRVTQDSEDLEIYNQGVFVQTMGTWKTGMGGVIVSKKPLEINLARNAILESKCDVWKSIQTETEKLVIDKLSSAKKLSEGERKFLARRALATGDFAEQIKKAKIITDPTGKHSTLECLKNYTKFVYIAEIGPLACSVHGSDGTFVVTDSLLQRFGMYCIEDFLRELKQKAGIIRHDAVVLNPDSVSKMGLGGAKLLQTDALSPRLKAAMATLEWLNEEVAMRLTAGGYNAGSRQLLLGSHKRNTFVAWTDGKTYITVNKHFTKKLEDGLNGAWFWAHTLVHEYMHDCDDSESHSHSEVFYQKFHDAIGMDELLQLGTLTQQTVLRYMNELRTQGLAKPSALKRQLRPSFG